MLEKEFPILEFDENKDAFIRPSNNGTYVDFPEHCVLCFFSEAIEKILSEFEHKIVYKCNSESIKLPVYELNYNGKRIILIQALVGAPLAGGQIEELTALGCKKYIVCGGCGVLQKELAVGHLIIPNAAVRDEGTSYHYAAPSREMVAESSVVQIIEQALQKADVPYITAKTWTTDAFFRETPAKIALRKSEGCVCVEMEASAYMAVAQYNNVKLGQILYSGDNLGGEAWDSREFNTRTEIREQLLRTTIDICLKL